MSRFDELAGDLSAQMDAALAAELASEVEDRTRREVAQVQLVGRLRASSGRLLHLDVRSGPVAGTVEAVGSDWLVLVEAPGRRALVPLAAVISVRGLAGGTLAAHDGVATRLDLGFALRRLVRDRARVAVTCTDGSQRIGRAERAAADHVDLLEEAGRTVTVSLGWIDVIRWA